MSPLRLLLFVVPAALLAAPSQAMADDDSGLAWGTLAGEASIAGVLALNFLVDDWPTDGPAFALNFAPMVLIPAAGDPAHLTGLDPRPAYAMHGASMVGLNLFMVGSMIDGRNAKDGLRAGPVAVTLGAIGAMRWTPFLGPKSGVAKE
ncbi:MAG: hypothetical protein GY811_17805 [Myxococcales bacterium]|nr:hypothetical protein [Myxococcales bacterium]